MPFQAKANMEIIARHNVIKTRLVNSIPVARSGICHEYNFNQSKLIDYLFKFVNKRINQIPVVFDNSLNPLVLSFLLTY